MVYNLLNQYLGYDFANVYCRVVNRLSMILSLSEIHFGDRDLELARALTELIADPVDNYRHFLKYPYHGVHILMGASWN